ncbi:MAG: GEVED domain-containing protein [Litorilinea sp.]
MIHLLRRGYGLTLSAAFALTLIWLGLAVLPASAKPNVEINAFTLDITPDPPTAAPGETIVYTMTLVNSEAATRTVAFSATLTGPVDGVRIELVRAASEKVSTQRSLRTAQGIRWLGAVGSEGTLTLRVTTRGDLLTSAGGAITLAAAAGPGPNNLPLQASATVPISELPPLNIEAMELDILFTDDAGIPIPVSPTGAQGEDSITLPSYANFRARVTLTNTGETPVVGLLTGAFLPTIPNEVAAAQDFARSACAIEVTAVRVDSGVAVPVRPAAFGASAPRVDYAILATLGRDSTARFELQLELRGGYGCVLESVLQLRARALPTTFEQPLLPRPGLLRNLFQVTPQIGPSVFIFAALSDLGDAPDSTNHFGASMRAYAGVTANFPTVFDPATGLPQGPKHRFVRPLFLGDQVSQETEADLTFLPLNRNIDPPNDIPDLDRFDDGVNVGAMALQHCVPTTVPFRVTFSQAAVDRLKQEGKTAYLNIWLDGNRDGDWDDVLGCDGIQAPEHIVIDQVVMPAAGGVYSLIAPTGNLPIPQNQVGETMWLRATLSDEPSVKTGQVTALGQVIDYGDGRGPAGGFRLGETEDYLVKPAGYQGEQGPDISIDVSVAEWDDIVLLGDEVIAQTQLLKRVRLRNLGDMRAAGTLIIETTPNLGIPEVNIAEVETAVPAQLPFSEVCPTLDDCHLELPLAELAPGALRDLILGWEVEEGERIVVDFNFRVEIDGVDAAPGNNVFEVSRQPRLTPLNLLTPAPGVVRQPLTATVASVASVASHWPQPLTATVTSGVVTGLPGASWTFRTNNELLEPQTLDANGNWSGPVPLGLGDNLVSLEYLDAPGYDQAAIEKYNDTERKIIAILIANNLPWNPASFGVRFGALGNSGNNSAQVHVGQEGGGIWNVLDEAGNTATDGWILPVIRGQEMQITLNTTTCGCSHLFTAPEDEGEGPAVTLQIGAMQPQTLLPVVNGGGLHQLSTILSDVADGDPVTLTIGCEDDAENQTYGQCWVYTGVVKIWQPVQVADFDSDGAVDGADFLIWQRGANGQAVPWHSGAYGQSNPVTTNSAGEAFIMLPPGDYGVTVRAEGYHPLRLGSLSASFFNGGRIQLRPMGDPLPTEEITLAYTDEGFEQATLEVTPGTRLRMTNASLGQFEIQDFLDAATPVSVQSSHPIQSGLIDPGEDFVVEFAELGDVRLVNTQNPGDELLIRVAEPQAASPQIFLPFMARTVGDGE